MTRKGGLVVKVLLLSVVFLLLQSPLPGFAFRAPDEAPSQAPAKSEGLSGLESVNAKSLNLPVTGAAAQAALDTVQAMVAPAQAGSLSLGRQSLSRGGAKAQATAPKSELLSEQVDNLGFRHIRVGQSYKGLPVVGAELVVHVNARNEIYQVNGAYLPPADISTVPAIDPDTALQAGLRELRDREGLAVATAPSLVIFGASLAYSYELSHEGPQKGLWKYFVDARTGKVLGRYDGIRYAAPNQGLGSAFSVAGNVLAGEGGGAVSVGGFFESTGSTNYFLYSFINKWGVYDVDVVDWEQQATSDWGLTDQAAVSAGKNFEDTQTYVAGTIGWTSFDDAGGFARANVHEGTDYVNAFWDGTSFYFGDGDGVTAGPLTTLDIVAHEFGHAITDNTSALIYAFESGALNEAYSDIFATTVEFATQPDGTGSYPAATAGSSDWLVGEDAWLTGTAQRDMSDPQRFQQPSYYRGTWWQTGTADNGGVHTNSGVANFAYYLLAVGGSGTNDGVPYNITGIGEANAAAVAMRANMYYHTSTDGYAEARQHWITAASDLALPTATVEDVWTACGVMPVTPCAVGYTVDGNAPYAFEDISGTGTDMLLGDDDEFFPVAFDFTFYCEAYSAAAVSANGAIFFEGGDFPYINASIPGTNTLGVNSFIAPLWNDLDPSAAGAVLYEVRGIAPDRRLIVQWDGVPVWGGVNPGTFQAILYEATGEILFQYLDVDFGDPLDNWGASATVGVQRTSGTGTQYSFNNPSLANGKAVLFTPTAQANITCGSVPDGSFENGPPPASWWTEVTNTSQEWIVDPVGAWGIGASDGAYAFWAGGYDAASQPNSGYVEQVILVPSGAASLEFSTNFYRVDADDPSPDDVFTVSVNGTPLFTRDMTLANNSYPVWTRETVDVSAYAGLTVTLRFEGSSTGTSTGNVLVDDVSICGAAKGLGTSLAIDFNTAGLWGWNGVSWSLVHPSDVDTTAGWSGGLAVDIGTSGLWNWNGSYWTFLHASNPDGVTGWDGGLAVDFGAAGLWNWDGSSWSMVHPFNVETLAGWAGGLAVDFGAAGLWSWNGSVWTLIDPTNIETMSGWSGGLAIDFGAQGLWNWNGSSWLMLDGANVDGLAMWSGGLAVDIGVQGLWNWDGSTWLMVHPLDIETMAGWTGGLALDFGAVYGIWNWDGGAWIQLHTLDPDGVTGVTLPLP